MSDPFVGQIIRIGFNFAPVGWMLCNGQILAISQFEALYSVIGTTYGGNGTTTFGLPDLRGRVPVGTGQGQGLPRYTIGQVGGSEDVTLNGNQMPQHWHYLRTIQAPGTSSGPFPPPSLNVSDEGPATISAVFTYAPYDANNQVAISKSAISPTPVGTIPHENRQPLLAVQYCIAVSGVWPPHG
jgi:microcystin-dependent protein